MPLHDTTEEITAGFDICLKNKEIQKLLSPDYTNRKLHGLLVINGMRATQPETMMSQPSAECQLVI